MAYIGAQPSFGNFQACDAISVVNGQAAYTLQVGGANISPQSAQHCLVSLNGVLQAPISSYTISGSTLTFAANLATGDSIDFITILGDTLDLGVPSDDTVGAAQIKADLISGTTALTAEPADTDEFLVSDAGTLKRIDYSLIKATSGLGMADQFRLSTTQNMTQNTATLISANIERVDTDGFGQLGTGMTESSGIFTFPSTGIYLIIFDGVVQKGPSNYIVGQIHTTTDNSSYDNASSSLIFTTSSSQYANFNAHHIFDVTNTSTHKCAFYQYKEDANQVTLNGETGASGTTFTFLKLGDT